MSALEEALTLQRGGECWEAFADPRYESANAMFGGWTTAVALRAVIRSGDSEARPSAITMNFVESQSAPSRQRRAADRALRRCLRQQP